MVISSRPPVKALSLPEWEALIKPEPGQGESVEIGARADEPLPRSIADVRRQVAGLDYQSLDPYVASVAGSIAASQVELPKGEEKIVVQVPEFYKEDVEVLMGRQNGPFAPMLVVLPGIHSSGESSHSNLLKKLALERGMNYVCLPNSMSKEMLEDMPLYHPGNPRVDALATRKILENLRDQYPEFFTSISVAGYSYGGLHGANLIRLDEESSNRLIDGNFVAISPPENLEHSMVQLDDLRELYKDGTATISDTGLKYKRDVKKYGYDGFYQSELSKHTTGSNVDEIEIADKYGSRDSLKELLEIVDTQFGHNQLPMNTEEYKQAGLIKKVKMRQEHKRIVENITYRQFSDEWLSKDSWLQQNQLTPEQMASKYSFTNAMEAVSQTPVLMMGAADDYILNRNDVDTLRKLETNPGPLEVSRMFSTGGHVSLDWNPKVAETLIDFAAADNLK
ncbi:MAG: hypothetical protein KF760_03770 [Candidatus Eremiobacteraeota bacterium]|nr:hypothetical protein [Candidatus Eremiobacteraeota bacterium]MCW5872664.1 hypothetical protein [Candidatus Eremiobacteraeota bacterium]